MSLPNVWTSSNSGCSWSPGKKYRYWLYRRMIRSEFRLRACIGLNPSTADETTDDRTVRRLVVRAADDGFAEFVMLNLFAYRSTDPDKMLATHDPVGKNNNADLLDWCRRSEQIVLCWGNHGSHLGRSAQVLEMLRPYADKLYCFGLTKSGEPRHPLYLPKNTPLVKWEYPT